MFRFVLASCLTLSSVPALAQDATTPQTDAEWMSWMPDAQDLQMPALAFEEDQEDLDNYEKYFYFHREETDFETAFLDIRECDAHARGLFRGNYYPNAATTALYGVGGLVGGLIGGAISDAIYGSAEIRRKRRVNMRRCMFYKGYERFGIDEDLWEEFNFEEGNSDVPEEERQRKLAQQALVAFGPRPVAEELGL